MHTRLSAKEMILHATKELLWKHGYKAMSPKMIMKESGAGQGSLYHHFDGKPDLAQKALCEVEEAMLTSSREQVFTDEKSVSEQLCTYLSLPREALKGCRMGRMAYDPEVVVMGELRLPVERYFKAMHALIKPCVVQLIEDGVLVQSVNAAVFTHTIVATVQGGYILARAYNDPKKLDDALEGLQSLIFNKE